MELKNFISQVLTSIVEGVVEAQNISRPLGALVNPGGLTKTTGAISADAIWDDSTNNIARLVTFDIAVTAESGKNTSAKIGVLAGLLDLGANGASQQKELAASRIQFSVPLLLPVQAASSEARRKKATLVPRTK